MSSNMEQLARKFLAAATVRRVIRHDWKANTPYPQPHYTYSVSSKKWQPSATTTTSTPSPRTFSIYSWNIDFMLPCSSARLISALNHLHTLTSENPRPSIILLQEMTSADLAVIQDQAWIQTGYHVTDVSNEFWASDAYGTCALVSRDLGVERGFRVHYPETIMERDALFFDVGIGGVRGEGEGRCLRVCNTHLESLDLTPARRPGQMACAARFVKGDDGGAEVWGSVLGGDLNAIQPFDLTLHEVNGLEDAYLASGGKEGGEEGFTWGQMARTEQRTTYGLSRMDKLFFCGGVRLEHFETFGYGVEVEGESNREELIQQGLEKPWVTDHLGVHGDFRIPEDHKV